MEECTVIIIIIIFLCVQFFFHPHNPRLPQSPKTISGKSVQKINSLFVLAITRHIAFD